MEHAHPKLQLPQRSGELTNKNRNSRGRKPVKRAITSTHQIWSPSNIVCSPENSCGQMQTWFWRRVMLGASAAFLSIGGGPVPHVPTLQKYQVGWDRVGLSYMMFFMQKPRIWSFKLYVKPFSTQKNMHKNIKAKSLCDTYAAWSLGSPAPPVCVAAGASTAALHDSREREEKEAHQSKKHFQIHHIFFFICQGTSKQQNEKDPPPILPHCNCRSGLQQSGFRALLRAAGRGSCAGSWQGDKNPQSQACFSILSRASTSFQTINIKKQTKRNTSWQSSNKHRVTPQLLMTPESSNYHVQIKLIWQNYWSLL